MEDTMRLGTLLCVCVCVHLCMNVSDVSCIRRSDSGVVNIYDTHAVAAAALSGDSLSSSSDPSAISRTSLLATIRAPPKPLKTLFNLTTQIDQLLFNADTQVCLGCRYVYKAISG